jgi:hypothetical protein
MNGSLGKAWNISRCNFRHSDGMTEEMHDIFETGEMITWIVL